MYNNTPLFIGSEVYRSTAQGHKHPLGIPRVSLATDLCRALGWLDHSNFIDSPCATKAELADFHDPAYIDAVEKADLSGDINPILKERYKIGLNGNPIFHGMYVRPATACGGGLLSARRVSSVGGVFYNIGGGQHHARPDRASGFCYFNEPVLTIRALLRAGIERVFYIDLDAHHGDGVQEAFMEESRVFTCSIHEFDRWPMARNSVPGDPGTVEDGGPEHRNLPVVVGFNDAEFDYLMDTVVFPLVQAFRPQVVYCQAGCDALFDDPQSKQILSNRAIWRGLDILKNIIPNLIVSGGGGYNPYAVGRCWAGLWATLNGYEIPDRLPKSAELLMRKIKWTHRMAKNPAPKWFSTLFDEPSPGTIREETKDLARKSIKI